MVHDWRKGKGERHGPLYDAATGAEVLRVFYYDDVTHRVGRYAQGPSGGLIVVGLGPVELWETRPLRFDNDDADTPIIVGG